MFNIKSTFLLKTTEEKKCLQIFNIIAYNFICFKCGLVEDETVPDIMQKLFVECVYLWGMCVYIFMDKILIYIYCKNCVQGRHALVYDIHSTNETWEWVDLKEVGCNLICLV